MRLKLDKEPGLPPLRSVIMTTNEAFMLVKTVYGYYTMLNLNTGILIEEEYTLVKELLQKVNQKYTIVRIIPSDNIEIEEIGYRHKFPRPPKPDPIPKPDPEPDPTPDDGENTDPDTGTEGSETDTENTGTNNEGTTDTDNEETTETTPAEGDNTTSNE